MTFFDHKLPNKISSNYIEKSELFLILNGKPTYCVDLCFCDSHADYCRPVVACFRCRKSWNTSATTPVNDPANECPLGSVSGAAPLSQFPGAVERSTLPLACFGPLYNIALCFGMKLMKIRKSIIKDIRQAYTLYLPYLKTELQHLLQKLLSYNIVGKGYEVSVLDEAPNVPDGQVEREKIPVEYAAFPFGICKLPTEQGKRLPAVVDQLFQHSTDGGTGCIHCNCRHCVWNNIVAFANASSV
ncbi:hypothetical protein T06_7587 [Trichinella sp. T6]|nr:hypothetical protein T06_7587 [Trichinella sp. T6]